MKIENIESGDTELDSLIHCWLEWSEEDSKDKNLVLDLLQKKDFTTLSKIMHPRKRFGTAGIRARMGPGFAQLNDLVLIQISQGLAKYLLSVDKNIDPKGVVIGFDARHNSHRWAKLCAIVFLKLGFNVHLFSMITPTPWVPFTVRRKHLTAGIMVTASHNPKYDNGFKVFWHNGAQIKQPHDVKTHNYILEHLEPVWGQENYDESVLERFGPKTKPFLVDPLEEINDLYLAHLQNNLFQREMNENFRQNLVYTAMHGVGASYIEAAFRKSGFNPQLLIQTRQQRDPDPDFPTVEFPNPEEGKSALDLAMKSAKEAGARYILANDPDADRLAIAERLESGTWKVFTGNEIGSLLGWWQYQVHMSQNPQAVKPNLYFIASTVSSKMLRSVAEAEGLKFEETLTGFKWMANKAFDIESENGKLPENKKKTVLLAYEESIGFMCGTSVLDKDGISGFIRAVELIAFVSEQNMSLLDKLNDLYNRYGYHCSEISYFIIEDKNGPERLFHNLRNFNGKICSYPKFVGNYKITSVRDVSRKFDSSQPNNHCILPNSEKSEMITFQLENGTCVTVRTSGTEPKLKYYAEYCAKPSQKNWKDIEKELSLIVKTFIEDLIQPTEHGLKPRSA